MNSMNGEDPQTLGYTGANIARLWEHPTLCIAIFGVQFHTPEGQQLYGSAGIQEQIVPSLEAARDAGFLHQEQLMSQIGGVLLQYWRSYDDIERWARTLPHMAWWRWLLENAGADVSFYHEIYQVKTAEAIYERGCRPFGAALLAGTAPVASGEGQSRQRQQRFADAAQAAVAS